MPMKPDKKTDGLDVFSLLLGFDDSSPSEKSALDNDYNPKIQYRHVCIKGMNLFLNDGI